MSDETDIIIAITGHREYGDPAALYNGLDGLKAKQYFFGGARGVDCDALEYIARTQPGAIRTVVVPNTVSAQPLSSQRIITRYATEIIELKNTGPDRYMIRNQYMVDHSTNVKAFYDFRGSGGTYNTIEYSRQTGKPFSVHPMMNYDIQYYQDMSQAELSSWIKQMNYHNVKFNSFKSILLGILKTTYHGNMSAFAEAMGAPGAKSLEQVWSY